jgi:hypothetical protein
MRRGGANVIQKKRPRRKLPKKRLLANGKKHKLHTLDVKKPPQMRRGESEIALRMSEETLL